MSKLLIKEYDCLIGEDAADLCKIVFLSDLHGVSYSLKDGSNRIVNAVDKVDPDLVLVGGDMMVGFPEGDAKKTKIGSSLDILGELSKRYKIFHALGNHELRLSEEVYSEYFDRVLAMGVKVLDNKYEDILLKDNKTLRIYGLTLPGEYYPKFRSRDLSVSVIERALKTNRVSGGVKDVDIRLLLAHNPNYADAYEEFGADITLSGHVHGGVFRFKGRGLIGPDFKLFPQFSGGSYFGNTMNLFVSCGLGEHVVPFRINNPYEIMVINAYY